MNEPIQILYKFNSLTFNKNLENISHEESLESISNANSINWIAGHIVLTRNNLFKELGLKEFISGEKMKEIYERGTKLTDKEKAEDLETIKNLYEESQKIFKEELGKETDQKRLEEYAFFSFHESYHIGQIGIIRKLLGKEGAIR